MKTKDRIQILKQVHKNMDAQVQIAYKHHLNWEQLNKLKKQKLKIKDEIQRLEEN